MLPVVLGRVHAGALLAALRRDHVGVPLVVLRHDHVVVVLRHDRVGALQCYNYNPNP